MLYALDRLKPLLEVPKFIQTNAGGSQARFLTSKARQPCVFRAVSEVNPSQTHNTSGGGAYQGQSDSSAGALG